MKEFDLAFSEGNTSLYSGGRKNFAGHSFEEIVVHTFKNFATSQIDNKTATDADHRLIDAINSHKLTKAILKRYVEQRKIYNIDVTMIPNHINAEIECA